MRLFSGKSENLPQSDAKGPNVALAGVNILESRHREKNHVIQLIVDRCGFFLKHIDDPDQEERLPCHPSERDELAAGSKRGVVGGIERSRHPTLADLHSMAREHEHISDGKVKLL